jgi:hypothetical protein
MNIGFNAFRDAHSLRDLILGNTCKEIHPEAFSNCTSLVSLRIPYLITEITRNTFSGCSQLEEVIFEGNTQVHPDAFQNCPRLTRIQRPPIRYTPNLIQGPPIRYPNSIQGPPMIYPGSKKRPVKRYSGVIYGKYSNLKANLQFNKEGECPISLEILEENSDIAVLPCGHSFLEKPLHKWFLTKKECPFCKAIF